MMKGPCEHCGNPMKEFWTTQCMYKGNWPSRRAFVLSTFDPPCACDQYDEDMNNLARTGNRKMGLLILVLVIVIAGCFWLTRAHGQEMVGHTHEGVVGKFYQSWTMPDNRSVSCCHDQDCAPAETKKINGQWFARKEGDQGDFTPIPDRKVEHERDNPDGRSHVCGRRYGFSNTEFSLFCFIFGSGT